MTFPCKLCGAGARLRYDLGSYRMYGCRACDVAFIDPFPTDAEVARIFDTLYLPGSGPDNLDPIVRGQYAADGRSSRLLADHADYLKLISERQRPGRLLDVGCGTGAFLKFCRDAGWDAEGLELAPEAAASARSLAGAVVRHGKLEEVPSPERPFDVVTMVDFIEHVANPREVLSSARRSLKAGGLLFMALPNFDSLLALAGEIVYRITLGRLTHPLRILYPVTHFFHYTPASIRRLLESQGYDVESITQEGTSLDSLKLSPLLRAPLALLFQASRALGKQNRMLVLARKRP